MSIHTLEKFLPNDCLPILKKWFANYPLHIKITRERKSKLGDYKKLRTGQHQISVNGDLVPNLFFFVLTHEIAHLLAFEKYGRNILPHGREWKFTFHQMLLESLSLYEPDFQPIVYRFSKSPKASFYASTELVRYFKLENFNANENYIEELKAGENFLYQGNYFQIQKKLKKNYLCKNLKNGKSYAFKPLARVEKIEKP